jgi:hypothetical protein
MYKPLKQLLFQPRPRLDLQINGVNLKAVPYFAGKSRAGIRIFEEIFKLLDLSGRSNPA